MSATAATSRRSGRVLTILAPVGVPEGDDDVSARVSAGDSDAGFDEDSDSDRDDDGRQAESGAKSVADVSQCKYSFAASAVTAVFTYEGNGSSSEDDETSSVKLTRLKKKSKKGREASFVHDRADAGWGYDSSSDDGE